MMIIHRKERPTVKEVARHAGVSIATVSHVLNQTHYVSEELRLEVENAIRELDYKLNYVGRCLRKGKSGTVALIVPDIADPFFPEVTRGVEDFLAKHGNNLFLCNTDEDPSKERLYLETIESRQVDGVIIAPAISQRDTIINTLKQVKKPTVIVDRPLRGANFDQVFSDNVGGAYKVTNHLLQLGHRRIGIILQRPKTITIIDRLKGYRRALREDGIEIDEGLIAEGHFGVEGGYEAAELLLKKSDISAIFCTNDSMTLGTMLLLKDKGIKCPQSLSIVGFDDPFWARAFTPTLTTVAQQTYRMGYEAAQLLWAKLSSGSQKKKIQKIKLDTFLRIRESSRPKS